MERRLAERMETNVQLICRVPARPCRAFMQDLSHTGCRLEIPDALIELGGTAVIDLCGRPITGQVVWVRGNVAGVKFQRRLPQSVAIAIGVK